MLENKYSRISKTKRRLYIGINIAKIFLILSLVIFSDMLVIGGMRTMYKDSIIITILAILLRAVIVISAIIGASIYIYRVIGLVRDKYILKHVHIKGTENYKDIIVHVKNIPKEIVDELFK